MYICTYIYIYVDDEGEGRATEIKWEKGLYSLSCKTVPVEAEM